MSSSILMCGELVSVDEDCLPTGIGKVLGVVFV